YLVMTPDDDVTFPHAIDASLAYLEDHPDYTAAQGYVLRFGTDDKRVDIHRVFGFTPSIDDVQPLHRLYHLMRRYQHFLWAVFRTDAYVAAMRKAQLVEGTVFKEMMVSSVITLEGKVARLPLIFQMQGMEESRAA